jgi:pyruvate dehydrogenase E1 component alpha subunit
MTVVQLSKKQSLKAPAAAAVPDKALLLKHYQDMLLIRRFEEKCGQLYGMSQIAGFCHLYIGQEAVVVGTQAVLIPGDAQITSYRDHGHMLAAGVDPKVILAELMGRETGCSRGKGGSMHMFDVDRRFYGGHGIVGAQVPLGTGLAFAEKYRDTNNISVTYFGDGTVNQGQVYEAFNMAALWKLPALYIIENNEYAMGTSVARACSISELYKRGISFNIPGKQVNGMDVLEVQKAVEEAVAFIRAGNGPMILEMKTYRFRGHSMSDPAKYRTKEELASYKENNDPLINLKQLLVAEKFADEEWFQSLEKSIKEIVAEAVEFATNSNEPDPSELYTDIYK